jgi:serine/threonine protein kinase/tetratricopeptide (TPR) repeat protein
MVGNRVCHYRILEKLGAGGMGVVYKAEDLNLGRLVAIKFLPESLNDDPTSLQRFQREARAASSLNHPNICTIYEVGEHEGRHFIAMELLEGATVAARIERGCVPLADGIRIALGILAALQELHRKGLVHRDLKPSNVFLTENGVKLIDFGLARLTNRDLEDTQTKLTIPGQIVGTPNYISPEQLRGQAATAASDLFATGAILFEMLSRQPAFGGRSGFEILHAIQYGQPPTLSGSSAVAAADRVIHRALSKEPQERYPSAEAMAKELRSVLLLDEVDVTPRVQIMSRLIVLPFRVLRQDPEIDFLSFGLADAIASSLSGLESLIVRSSLAAARFAREIPDVKTIAAESDVDTVLTGTLLSAGGQLRVSTQLVEAPSGTLIWSNTAQVAMRDIFQLQDDLVNRIVESLSLPLTARDHRRLKLDVPVNATAYELYLRGNQLYHEWGKMSVARGLYLRCVEQDPRYAPAWARLGRCCRLMAKWSGHPDEDLVQAKNALDRALQINPDLPLAHYIYGQLEADIGRANDAMVRLLGRAANNINDLELFAGLTQVCRYCGLIEASLAAHQHARRLDPHIRTSVAHTHFMMGDYENVLTCSSAADALYIHPLALSQLGREREALELLRKGLRDESALPLIRLNGTSLLALLEGRRDDCVREAEQYLRSSFRDPESLYYFARQFVYLGKHARALEVLREVIELGHVCFPALARDPWFDSLRSDAGFVSLLRAAETRHREAAQAFLTADGCRILGVPAS